MKHAFLAYLVTASAAVAHPGHEAAFVQGDAHWLSQPDHAVVIALGAALAILAAVGVAAKRRRAARE